MKKIDYIFSYGGWIGTVICLVFLLFLDRSSDHPAPLHTIEKTKVIIYDSSKKEINPTHDPVGISIQTVGIPAQVDTAAILKAFFSVYTYSDQVQDSALKLQIFDSVTQNKIFGRKITYQWLLPIKTIESTTITTVPEPIRRHEFYLGGKVQASLQQFGIGPIITWKTKNKVLIGYGYDLLNNSHQLNTQFIIGGGRTKN